MDSKGVFVDIAVGPDPNSIYSPVECKVDEHAMKWSPVHIKFKHYKTQTSQRKVLWNEELDSNVR